MANSEELNQQVLKTKKNDIHIRELCKNKDYEIYEDGKILTLIQKTGKRSARGEWRELIHDVLPDSYHRVRYNYVYLTVHRIVYQKFIGELDFTKQINHKDGNRLNNHYSNLELVTQSENGLHSFRVLKRKPVYGNCKINFEVAEEIRIQRALGFSYKFISEKFNISKTSIADVLMCRTWKPKQGAS